MAIRSQLDLRAVQNAYGNHMQNALSKAGDDIDLDIEKTRKLQEVADTKARRELQTGILKSQQLKGLVVPSETEFESLNLYAQDMSRQLVDQYSTLVSSLEKNEIDSNQFAQQASIIQMQVPQIKNFVSGLEERASAWSAGLKGNTLSLANPPENESFFAAIAQNRGEFGMDENGVLVYQGKTEAGEDFSFPANKLQDIPVPIKKVESFVEMSDPLVDALLKPKAYFNEITGKEELRTVDKQSKDYERAVRQAFDAFLGADDDTANSKLRSLAADHVGMTRDQIKDAINDTNYEGPSGETFANRLEYEMEKHFVQTVDENYEATKYKNWKQAQEDLQMQKMYQQSQLAREAAWQGKTQTERAQYQTAKYMKGLSSPTEDLNSWVSGAGASVLRTFEKDTKDPDSGVQIPAGSIVIKDKGGKNLLITAEIAQDPNKLASFLSTRLYSLPPYMQSFNYKSTTPKDTSPIKKITNFLTGKK